MPKYTGPLNRAYGETFEKIFIRQAKSNGLYAKKNPTGCITTHNRIIRIKSDLDFRLTNKQGRTAFVDTKCFDEDFFTYAQIKEKQLNQAVTNNHWNTPSGFVVWFRKSSQIQFYSGLTISLNGPRTRFDESNGLPLGIYSNFDLNKVLEVV